MKRLIVNADDLGLTKGVEGLRQGSSESVLAGTEVILKGDCGDYRSVQQIPGVFFQTG